MSPPSARVTDGQLCSWRLLQVAAKALETGTFGAYFNVLINLKDVADDAFKDQVSRRVPGQAPQRDLEVTLGAVAPQCGSGGVSIC